MYLNRAFRLGNVCAVRRAGVVTPLRRRRYALAGPLVVALLVETVELLSDNTASA